MLGAVSDCRDSRQRSVGGVCQPGPGRCWPLGEDGLSLDPEAMAATAEITALSRPALPDPDLRPLADVLIYDGECRICSAQVELIERRFAAGRLAYLSLHDARVAVRYPDLSHDDLMRQMYVIDRRGHRYGGAEAVRI